ncbi:methyl-accepting chemotaxis protein [Pseudomonas sp. GCM10022186]|uniref:methyl-accepting chemotaxis protein n=1 Tax=Pseudomonas sp. GCM10022186 TaxID=3252650 RepID=UPI003607631E
MILQRKMIGQVSAAMKQMTEAAQAVAGSAISAVDGTQQVSHETSYGSSLVINQAAAIEALAQGIEGSVAVIERLASDSSTIGQVLDVIKSVAEQTNLLALNAAIEAARAGDQGRGFAVVADEVRSLAMRTQNSSREIERMICQLQEGAAAAVQSMDNSQVMANENVASSVKVRSSLENILKTVSQIAEKSLSISTSAEGQTEVALEVDSNILQINQAAEHTAAGASRAEQASQQLRRLVEQLNGRISMFRV